MQHHFDIAIERDHPAFAGHFPGAPIVPGVLLLDWVLCEIETREQSISEHGALVPGEMNVLPGEMSVAKFLTPVRPGDVLAVSYERSATKIACRIECRQQLVATATFALRADASDTA